MSTFIMTGRYSAEATKQISAKRATKGTQIVRRCGGELLAVYATMGKTDILVVAEFPGIKEAMKASVDLNRALGISFSTVPAISIEEFDKLVSV
jgi:uncharacterized protein with GYD domain